MIIKYHSFAIRDMERFREFMRANGAAEERIDHILNGVMDSVLNLEGNPRLGFSLGARRGFTTPYRAYITDPYIVIYEVVGDTIEVRRIYHQKEDYIRDILIIEP